MSESDPDCVPPTRWVRALISAVYKGKAGVICYLLGDIPQMERMDTSGSVLLSENVEAKNG